MEEYTFIDSQEGLEEAHRHWSKCKILGIDLECENNLHYYGTYISIIQVSSRERHWIVDVLALQQIEPLLTILEDPHIEKIFHDSSFDLMMLYHQFRCRPNNIFDTQIAAHFLGKKELGLGALLKEFFGVEKQNHFQMVDWTKRPLTEGMLSYAVGDTKYLPRLRDILSEDLLKLCRLSWVQEEFSVVETKGLIYLEKTFMDFPGSSFFTDLERSVLQHLFELRKKMAKEANKPPYFVISTKRLTELVKNPPKSIDEWKNIRGVHPIVRKNARMLYDAVEEGRKCAIPKIPIKKVHYTPKQSERLKKLSEIRDAAAVKLGIQKHLLLSKEQMQDIALTGHVNCLRNWQRELFASLP